MAETARALVKEGYIFQESDDSDVFYFYREDGENLSEEEILKTAIKMYREYFFERMLMNEVGNKIVLADNIKTNLSKDGKILKISLEEEDLNLSLGEAFTKSIEDEIEEIAKQNYESSNLPVNDVNERLKKLFEEEPDDSDPGIEVVLRFGPSKKRRHRRKFKKFLKTVFGDR